MEWRPFGKESNVVIEAFRRGCGGVACVHVTADIAMGPNEAARLCKTIMKAIKYAEGER
jgi:hypothetical protein